MRLILAAAVVLALACVKVHSLWVDGTRVSRIVVNQPLSWPIDSLEGYCLRKSSETVAKCAVDFVDWHKTLPKIATFAECIACTRISKSLSSMGKPSPFLEDRAEAFELMARMAKP